MPKLKITRHPASKGQVIDVHPDGAVWLYDDEDMTNPRYFRSYSEAEKAAK